MATLPFLSLLFIFLWFPHATRSTHICEKESCQWTGPHIQFPFRLRESNQSNRCSYPGFELLCNDRRQTLLTIPNAGDFLVKGISLQDQKVWINDPDLCLPRRFLHNINLTANSPFRFSDEYSLVNLTFLNCPSNLTDVYTAAPITCLSPSKDGNYSVIAVLPDSIPFFSSCQFISSALFPSVDTPRWLFWNRIYADVALQWSTPDCKHCQGGHCGFSSDSGLDVACYGDEGQGLSRKAKYAIALGLGIPGLIGLIVLAYLVRGEVNLGGQQRPRQPIIELSGSNMPQPGLVAIGLDASTIEKYPITQLDESGGILLPNHNDNICSICLCEYQPKETLRTIPQCNHYFHVNCIDGWLKMNAACPLCRKLPERSSLPAATSLFSTNS